MYPIGVFNKFFTLDQLVWKLHSNKKRANSLDQRAANGDQGSARILYLICQENSHIIVEIDYRRNGELLPSGD